MPRINMILKCRIAVIGALLIALSGCSASFTYNNIGWLSAFWIDDYVDLTKQQSKQAKALIKQSRDWHRKTQLPLYRQDLLSLQKLLINNPSEQALLSHFQGAKVHWQSLVLYVKDDLVALAMSLSAQQRQEFVDAIAKDMADDVEQFNEQTELERKQERLERQLDTYKDWLGPLDDQQIALISQANSEFQSTFLLWQAYKQARLDKLKQVFFDPQLSREQFISQLSMVITEREAFMSDELIRLDANNAKHYVQLLINLRATITAKQLKHANAEFADMLKDIEQLIAND
ncbi:MULTISPECIES: DUF6279 family lipoprotein [Pseudoalteromonas]|uniref:Lipoprotein n=1 Tax=Pseudoalteromonas prydzensis TaxID=182141 RepID=A0ABR9FK89_9GAMM|nr:MULTISPECIES: DUF6279 family lipoprotein [Pseudoalteromonas]MBE0457246.1 hypothetical protein [Pseudoalteromonas prydzensis]WKD26063.1 DUF6279 family lipoprotein [Pseudoalteromonas sp. KG3]